MPHIGIGNLSFQYGGVRMTKALRCRDVGHVCAAVVTSESDEKMLAQVADHAKTAHGMTDDQIKDPVFLAQVREKIHEQVISASRRDYPRWHHAIGDSSRIARVHRLAGARGPLLRVFP